MRRVEVLGSALFGDVVGKRRDRRFSGGVGGTLSLTALSFLLAACGSGGSSSNNNGGGGGDTTPPELADGDSATGVQSLTIDTKDSAYKLVVHLNEAIKQDDTIADTDLGKYIEIYQQKAGATEFTKLSDAAIGTLSVENLTVGTSSKGQLKILLSENGDGAGEMYSVGGATYKVKFIKPGLVKDTAGNALANAETTAATAPDTTPPVLADGDSTKDGVQSLTISADNKVLTIHFDEVITAIDKAKFKASIGTTTITVPSEAIAIAGKTITLTLPEALPEADYTVTIEAGGVTSAGGATTADVTTSSVTALDITPPKLAVVPLEADKVAGTITVDFDEEIASVDPAMFTVKYDAEGPGAGADEITLTVDATADGFTVAVAGGKAVITLAGITLADDDKVTVAIAADGVTDSDGNKNEDIAERSYTVGADNSPPALADGDDTKEGTQSLTISADNTVLTVHFDEAITAFEDTRIEVSDAIGEIAMAGNTLTITYDNALAAGEYTVTIRAGGVTSAGGSTTVDLETSTIDKSPPALADGKIFDEDGVQSLTIDSENKILTVHFDDEITTKDDAKIKVDGAVLPSGATVAIAGSTLTITYTDALAQGDHTVTVEAGGVTSAGGATAADVTTSTVTAPDITPPVLADGDSTKDGDQTLTIDSENKILTVHFDEAITAKDDAKIKVDGAAIAGGVVAIAGSTLTITYTTALAQGDHTVTVEAGGVTSAGGATAADVTTSAVTVLDTTPPVLVDGDSTKDGDQSLTIDSENKILTVHFDDEITAKDDAKIKVDGAAIAGGVVAIAGSTLTITYTTALAAGDHTVTVEAGGVTSAGGSVAKVTTSAVTVSGASDDTPPVLVDGDSAKDGVQSLTIDSEKKILTVHFDEAITAKDDAKIKVDDVALPSGATVAMAGSTLTITLTDALAQGDHTVTIEAGGVTSAGGTTTAEVTTSAVTVDTTPPALADGDSTKDGVQSLTISADNTVLTIYFDDEITGFDATKFKLSSGVPVPSHLIAMSGKTLTITLTNGFPTGDYTVKIEEGGVTSAGGTTAADVTTSAATVPDKTPPVLADGDSTKGGEQSLTIDSENKILTVHFDDEITAKDDAKIKVDGVAIAGGVVAIAGSTLTITYTEALAAGNHTVTVEAGGVTSVGGATFASVTTSAVTVAGASDDTPPVLADGDGDPANGDQVLTISADNKVLTVHFDEAITAKDDAKIKVDGAVLPSGATVAIAGSTLTITLTEALAQGDHTVTIEAGGVTSAGGTTTADVTTSAVTAPDITPPVLVDGDTGTSGDQTLTIDWGKKVLTVHFDEAITEKVDASIVVKNAADTTVSGGTIAISGSTLTITYTDALSAGDHTVTIEAGGVTSAGGVTTALLTTSPVAVDLSPPVLAGPVITKGSIPNSIVVNFDEKIALVDKTKLTVKYDAGGPSAGADEITLATNSLFTTLPSGKVNITMTSVTGLKAGDVLKIAIAAGGVTDEDGNKNEAIAEVTYTIPSSSEDDGLIGIGLSSDSDYGL